MLFIGRVGSLRSSMNGENAMQDYAEETLLLRGTIVRYRLGERGIFSQNKH